jgi:AraC-like DNA-binding protein
VQRFQQVLQQVEQQSAVDWAGVAATYGYADQSHLIHDFQTFAGLSPTAYLTHCGRHRNHVPIEE